MCVCVWEREREREREMPYLSSLPPIFCGYYECASIDTQVENRVRDTVSQFGHANGKVLIMADIWVCELVVRGMETP